VEAISNGHPTDGPPVMSLGSTWGQPPDATPGLSLGQPADSPPDRSAGWSPMAEAAEAAGVTRRTLRRWCAEGRVESQLVGQRGAQVRWIKLDSLRTEPTDSLRSQPADEPMVGPADAPRSQPADTPRSGPPADPRVVSALRAERDRLANEVDWLRRQVEEMRSAEREMRILIARALPDPTPPALAERNVTPAPEPPKRVRWWAKLWGTR
jgi:hypothetical protein